VNLDWQRTHEIKEPGTLPGLGYLLGLEITRSLDMKDHDKAIVGDILCRFERRFRQGQRCSTSPVAGISQIIVSPHLGSRVTRESEKKGCRFGDRDEDKENLPYSFRQDAEQPNSSQSDWTRMSDQGWEAHRSQQHTLWTADLQL